MDSPTIKDVAEEAGVSISAVSLYLNDRAGISQETRKRIAAAVEGLGYQPRANGRKAKKAPSAATRYIGLLTEKLPIYSDHFYAEVIHAMQAEAERLGYGLVLGTLDPSKPDLPRVVTEQHVSGHIVIGGGDVTDELITRLAESKAPLLLVDNESWLQEIDSVMVDNHRGAYLATQHLIELGHRRIAIICGPAKYKTLQQRLHGYVAAQTDAGIRIDERYVQPSISKGQPRKGYLEMQQLLALDSRPTAVFAVSDRSAFGALDAIREAGLRVPDDISLVGFDNVNSAIHTYPPLTTVGADRQAMGTSAMRRMHDLLRGKAASPLKIVVYMHLVVRQSTKPPRS
jgi:DNA-binding LacI/PurR family transcriptional regulator